MFSVEKFSVEVRIYPSLKKYIFNVSVSSTQTLISNFLLLMRKGFSTYFWMTKEQVFNLNFSAGLHLVSGVEAVESL